METIIKFYFNSIDEELEFLSNGDLWTKYFSSKVVVRAAEMVHKSQMFMESFEEVRKSSVYPSIKKATSILFNAFLRLAGSNDAPDAKMALFLKAHKEFNQLKEDILKEIQS